MATLTETEDAYDRHDLRGMVLDSRVADVILNLENERDELLVIIGTETPIAAFDLVTTWRTEKAGYMEQVVELEAERDKLRTALLGLIGADRVEELRMMEAAIRMTPAPAADKAAMLDAIHALLAEYPRWRYRGKGKVEDDPATSIG